jgi:nicotinate-nucleotide pyrophosphorylase (carboxylating)
MNRVDPLDPARIDAMVRAALEEDGARHDVTSDYLGLRDGRVSGDITLSAPAVVCGIDVARAVFHAVDASSRFDALCADGERAPGGTALCRIEGPAPAILAAERTALNFLQRMCGVATLASRYVDAVEGTGVVILDTRKTIPLWRELDKYAVRCGGAQNHRRALSAMVLVKDNHVRAVGGSDALVERLSRAAREQFVEVEVDSFELLERVAQTDANRIMLDNFSPEQVAEAMEWVRGFRNANPGRGLEIEVSGGITLENVREYAQPGVDFISIGAMTHSAPAASMSLSLR